MTMDKHCAALSAVLCSFKRIGETHPQKRRLSIPSGWSEVMATASAAEDPTLRVRAFIDGADNMVLAFAGPDFIADAMPVSKDASELAMNLALDMGLYSFTAHLQAAIQAYAALRQWAYLNGKDAGRVRFTGHGAGGGVASVMSVWFDQPSTTFAQAPLRAVALTPGDFAAALRTIEALLDSADAAVRALNGFIRHPQEVLAQREQLRVTHWHVRGELYATLRSPATAIRGTEHAIDVGVQPLTVKTALTLHDMQLHAALCYDPRLSLLCQESPELLSLLMDRDEGSDLVETLVSDQHRVGLNAESSLQRFVSGLKRQGEERTDSVLSRSTVG